MDLGEDRTMAATAAQRALWEAVNPREWEGHFLLCGWRRGAEAVLEQLATVALEPVGVALVSQAPPETITHVLDQLRARLGAAADLLVLRHVPGNPADEAVLAAAGAARARAAVILADEAGGPAASTDDRVLSWTLAVRDATADAQIVAEVLRLEAETHVRKAGASEVMVRDAHTPFYLAAATRQPGLGAAARQLFRAGGPQSLRRAAIPDHLRGASLAAVRDYLRQETGALVVGIITEPDRVTVEQLLGSSTDWVDRFIQRMFAESGQDLLRQQGQRREIRVNPPDDYVIGPRDFAIIVPPFRPRAAGQPA